MTLALSFASLAVFAGTTLAAGAALLSRLAVAFALAGHAMFTFAVLTARTLCCCINQAHCRQQ